MVTLTQVAKATKGTIAMAGVKPTHWLETLYYRRHKEQKAKSPSNTAAQQSIA